MREHRPGAEHGDEDALLRRWYAAASRSRPIPSADLLAAERAHRVRRPLRKVALALVAIAAVVAGIAGAGLWASFRGTPGSSPSRSVVALATGTPSPVATGVAPTPLPSSALRSGPGLAAHEFVVQMHRTATGGWLLTRSRFIVTDGSSWRDCLHPSGGFAGPLVPKALVSGSIMRVIDGLGELWTSGDGCTSWIDTAFPIGPEGVAFPTASTIYLADRTDPNRAQVDRSDNGGRVWSSAAVEAPTDSSGIAGFYGDLSLAFADADQGWLTDGHSLWTTLDGGASWTTTSLPVPGSVRGQLDFITTPVVGADGNAVIVAKFDTSPGMDGARGQRVFYRTIDHGLHWTAAAVLTDPGMLSLSIADPTTWVVLDEAQPASLQVTTDAGATWRSVEVRKAWPFNAGPIDFADALHGWMVVNEPEPPCGGGPGSICDYAYPPPQHLAETNDGGVTWTELP